MSAPATAPVWSGSWVTDRLGLDLATERAPGGLRVEHLVGLALRVNPRRAHLLVSRVLGKHVPTDPRLVYGAGRLLGALVADRLAGTDGVVAEGGGRLLAAALTEGDPDAPGRLLALCDRHRAGHPHEDALVVGYAETATGLGHSVADALDADYLHSTRRPLPGLVPLGAFEEAHSHATGHLLLPADPGLVTARRPVVLVDDELSTGDTVMATIRALQAAGPRERYVVAALVDLRSSEDRRRMAEFARALGVRVDVVALAVGRVRLSADVLVRGRELVARHAAAPRVLPPRRSVQVREMPAPWPEGVPDGGRHGFLRSCREPFESAVAEVAAGLLAALLAALPRREGARVLVLGTEELMYLPLRVAVALAELAGPATRVVFSSTTRSPVLPIDDPGYAVRTALRFASHDDPADGPGTRFAYNVAAATGEPPLDAAVLVVDDRSRSWPPAGIQPPDAGRLPDLLAGVVAGPVTVLTVPSARPAAAR